LFAIARTRRCFTRMIRPESRSQRMEQRWLTAKQEDDAGPSSVSRESSNLPLLETIMRSRKNDKVLCSRNSLSRRML
jgi:hypothetical protein